MKRQRVFRKKRQDNIRTYDMILPFNTTENEEFLTVVINERSDIFARYKSETEQEQDFILNLDIGSVPLAILSTHHTVILLPKTLSHEGMQGMKCILGQNDRKKKDGAFIYCLRTINVNLF